MSNTPPTAAVSTPPDGEETEGLSQCLDGHAEIICWGVRTSSTFLEPQLLQNVLKLCIFAHVGKLHVHTGTQASAQVGGAGEDVAQVLVPHEGVVPLLEQGLDLVTREEDQVLVPMCEQPPLPH